MNSWLLVAFFITILLVGGTILFLITYGRRSGVQLNVERYRRDWFTIERQLVRDQESSYHLAVLNADKLLGHALKQRGFRGETMGERMKTAQNVWTNTQSVWTAHKLRNQIAHEPNVKVTYDTARHALAAFKQALKDVGAI